MASPALEMETNPATRNAEFTNDSDALEINTHPAMVSAIFFGFVTSAKRNPIINAFHGEMVSMTIIHFGMDVSSSGFGRFCHRRIAPKSNNVPSNIRRLEASVEGCVTSTFLLLMVSINTAIQGNPIPKAQPSRNAGPFQVALAENNINITVMRGTGLMAIPTA